MPSYDYECPACGHEFEKFQPITARPVARCPGCGSRRARRLIGAGAALLFKGAGFYITDYRSSEYRSQARAEKESRKKTSESSAGTGKNGSGGSSPAPSGKRQSSAS